MHQVELILPRHAFGPRETARSGEIWRSLQDIAVLASSRAGYTPRDYREQQIGWVMRSMTVRHLAEIQFGEPVVADTWISTFERDIFSNRQIRMSADDRPVVLADQRWVHVRLPDLRPVRASAELKVALGELLAPLELEVPQTHPIEGEIVHACTFDTWHSQMDPLGHANHPAYIDWVEEAWCRWLASRGFDPQQSYAVAESVTYRSGVVAPAPVTVQLELRGTTPSGAAVIEAEMSAGDRPVASAWAIRAVHGFTSGWAEALNS